MTYRADLLVPFGYARAEKPLSYVRTWLLEHHHPEFVERLLAWLDSKNGLIGPGGGWRAGGAQPNKPGFAPEGKSFHQDQNFNDGFCGAAAVDLVARNGANVHRAPTWNEVPAQGSAEAAKWGVHCNVGAPGQTGSEPWHMQPVELDGWQTWWNQGRPAPKPNYPFPGRVQPAPKPEPAPSPQPEPDPAPVQEDALMFIARDVTTGKMWLGNLISKVEVDAVTAQHRIAFAQRAGKPILNTDGKPVLWEHQLATVLTVSDAQIRALGGAAA